ncbi:MAG TPA: DUF4926 domain-containing protein [Dehalococcoidia bacterium]|nr:DUF4926 domain-containing protein [Dehalococcoidia bacterium]
MAFALLDTVVLNRDPPAHRLCAGDLGAVVDVYPDGVEVEFVRASGSPCYPQGIRPSRGGRQRHSCRPSLVDRRGRRSRS